MRGVGIIAAVVGVTALVLGSRSSRRNREQHPAGAYGPKWGSTRPPGLPTTARYCSAEGDAADAIRRAARSHGLGEGFVAFALQLGAGESGQCFGRPANNFDARLMAGYSKTEAKRRRLVPNVNTKRPASKKLITAWGCFQFNRDAWRSVLAALGITPAVALPLPWECTPEEEIDIPVRWYARLWRQLKAWGLSDAQCGAMCRVWHWSPAAYAEAIDAFESGQAFATAWAAVPADRRATIEEHIDNARIGVVA